MSELHDRELADVIEANRRYEKRRRTAVEIVLDVDRTDPRWQRLRGACCDFAGLSYPLDEHADRIFLTLQTNGGAGSTLDGLSAGAAQGGAW